MSCNRDVPGDYELSEVIEAAGTDWYGVSEDEIGIFIDGPNLYCNASRVTGSDRVAWQVNGETAPRLPGVH